MFPIRSFSWNLLLIVGLAFPTLLHSQQAPEPERGPTHSDQIHPDRAKPAPPAATEKKNQSNADIAEQQQEELTPSFFSAWIVIPIAVVLLGFIFMRLSTASSRDPSRTPR